MAKRRPATRPSACAGRHEAEPSLPSWPQSGGQFDPAQVACPPASGGLAPPPEIFRWRRRAPELLGHPIALRRSSDGGDEVGQSGELLAVVLDGVVDEAGGEARGTDLRVSAPAAPPARGPAPRPGRAGARSARSRRAARLGLRHASAFTRPIEDRHRARRCGVRTAPSRRPSSTGAAQRARPGSRPPIQIGTCFLYRGRLDDEAAEREVLAVVGRLGLREGGRAAHE